MPLRVAFTHAFSWPEVNRGGERFLHELAGAMARRRHEVTILSSAGSWSLERLDGMKTLRIGRRMPASLRAEKVFARRVLPFLTAGRFDIVHSLGPFDALTSIRASRFHPRRRTVYTCLGIPEREEREYGDDRGDRAVHAKVVNAIDVYGCMSRYALSQLRTEFGRRGALTSGGVRLDTFRPAEPKAKEPTLLYSGALDVERKGLRRLLEALPILARREPKVRVWLAGGGDPSGVLSDAPAATRDRVDVLSPAAAVDQPSRFSRAWVTALPAIYEAFGLVVVESLACGTPVVVANHSALPELVTPGVGVITPPEDAEALAQGCEEALQLAGDPDSVERCRDAARPYDWDTSVAPAVEALYLGSGRDDS